MKTLIAITLLAVVASACGGFHKTPAEREARATRHITSLLNDVDATPEQQEQILAVTSEVRARFQEQRSDGARAVFAAQWSTAQPDEAVIRAAIEESAARRIADAHAVVDAGVRIHQTLTAEQRASLEAELPLKKARFAVGLARRVGYGPPATKDELHERAVVRFTAVLDELRATDAQRAALQPLLATVLDDAAPLTGTPEALIESVLATWRSDDGDAADLHALIDVEGELATLAARSAAESLVKAHAILTVEQRAVLGARLQRGGFRGADGSDRAMPVVEVESLAPRHLHLAPALNL